MSSQLNTITDEPSEKLSHLRNTYLDLMQSCLTGSIYRDEPNAPFGSNKFDLELRDHGMDWPAHAHTMIGTKRMANLRELTETVISENVPGDFIETGVWRGGACIFMRAILFAHDVVDRCVWVADSFEGLPEANEQQYPADAGSDFHTYEQLAVSLEEVQKNFSTYGLLNEQVKFLKGWFKDTLPTVPVKQFALIRLDGDMYESTMDALTNLYPKLSPQGFVILDEYHRVPACKAAVHDYCQANGIQPEIMEIDGEGVYWRKVDPNWQPIASSNLNQPATSADVQITLLKEALATLNQNVMVYLQNSLEHKDRKINNLTSTLTERDSEVIGLKQLLEVRVSQIENLHQSLGERDQTLAERDQTLAERDQTLAERNQTLAKSEKQLARLKQVLNDVYASTSWRVTKPLRTVKDMINRRK